MTSLIKPVQYAYTFLVAFSLIGCGLDDTESVIPVKTPNAYVLASEAIKAYEDEGIWGLRSKVGECYSKQSTQDFECVVWDITGYLIDKNFAEQLGGPREEYFSDRLFQERLNASSHLGKLDRVTGQAAFDEYVSQITKAMGDRWLKSS